MFDIDEYGFRCGCLVGFFGCFAFIFAILWVLRTILHMLFGEQVYIYVHQHHFLGVVDLINAAQLLGYN
ncbi:MAG: hypothetical protein ACFB2X_17960 [Rivularia sp. (in: cyanobacteria)]